MDELTDGLMEGTKIPNQTTIQTRIYQERDGTWTEKDTLRLLLVCQGFNNEILRIKAESLHFISSPSP